jgi:hypothetical protein
MMLWLLLHLLSSSALAQAPAPDSSFLLFPNTTAAITRSQQQCTALKCDGTQTSCWWHIFTSTDSKYAVIEIQASGPYAATWQVPPLTAPVGLTTAEQSNLKAYSAISSVLPKPCTDPTGATCTSYEVTCPPQ